MANGRGYESIVSRLQKITRGDEREALSPQTLEIKRVSPSRVLNNCPVTDLIDPKFRNVLFGELMEIFESIIPACIGMKDSFPILANKEIENELSAWYLKLFSHLRRELLDENGYIQADVALHLGGLGSGGKDIYRKTTISGFFAGFLNLIIQDLLIIAVESITTFAKLEFSKRDCENYMRFFDNVHIAVTRFITQKSAQETSARVSLKTYKNIQEHLDGIILEFVGTPTDLRTPGEYRVLHNMIANVQTAELLSDFLRNSLMQCQPKDGLFHILLKHYEIANSSMMKELEVEEKAVVSAPRA